MGRHCGPGLVDVGTFPHQDDGTSYTVTSTTNSPTECFGVSPLGTDQCGVNFTLQCNAVPTNAAAGSVTISGSEEEYCSSRDANLNLQPGPCPSGSNSTTICDTGTVSITVNGHTVSTTLDCNSTPLSVAAKLALALDQDSTLGPLFISAADGPVAYVHALNSGSQYNYSWTSSNACSSRIQFVFGECSFSAGLSPAASLSGGQ